MTKIIAPVSSYEGAVRVVDAGADELYCGVRLPGLKFISYSGRPAFCNLQDYDELSQIVQYAHSKNVTVNLTANLPFMADVLERTVKSFIKRSVACGVDALIVADMGTLLLIQNMKLDIPIYAGSYFIARNGEAAKFLRKLGVSRLIAPPDSTLDDLEQLVKSSSMEIEAFVHGEGCSNVGGNCYLLHSGRPHKEKYQSYDEAPVSPIASDPDDDKTLVSISKRIPCIFNYEVFEIDVESGAMSEGQQLPIMDSFTFCSLCYLPDLIRIGIGGVKIVGRCAPIEFQERVTRLYRRFIDLAQQNEMDTFQSELLRLREQSAELNRLCASQRCFYAPWSQRRREECGIPFSRVSP